MRRASLLITTVLVSVYLTGCAVASPDRSTPFGQEVPAARKTLSLGMVAEPGILATNALSGGTKNQADDLRAAIHHSLAAPNDRDEVVPQLAVEVPSLERGSWILLADGTMQTTYQLHPNARWHDGTPVTSRDFRFAWQMLMDPELPVASRNIPALIERIETPDDGTLVIFVPNSATLVANLLSGALDGAVSGVTLDEVFLIKAQWEQEGKIPSIPGCTGSWTIVSLQFRDPTPRDLLDVRVRRGLLHALDRQALVDSFSRGLAPVSHAIVALDDYRYDWVRDAIVQYPFDPRSGYSPRGSGDHVLSPLVGEG